jgi:hypothetical protein
MPRGRISKLGIKDGDPRVIFTVPEATYATLEAIAHGQGLSTNELARRRTLGDLWNPPPGSTMPPRPRRRRRKPDADTTQGGVSRENRLRSSTPVRELTVEYDGEVSR